MARRTSNSTGRCNTSEEDHPVDMSELLTTRRSDRLSDHPGWTTATLTEPPLHKVGHAEGLTLPHTAAVCTGH